MFKHSNEGWNGERAMDTSIVEWNALSAMEWMMSNGLKWNGL